MVNTGVLSVSTINNGNVVGNLSQAPSAAKYLVIGSGTLPYTWLTASSDRAFTITAGQTATLDITTNNLTVGGAAAVTAAALLGGLGMLTLLPPELRRVFSQGRLSHGFSRS